MPVGIDAYSHFVVCLFFPNNVLFQNASLTCIKTDVILDHAESLAVLPVQIKGVNCGQQHELQNKVR